MVSKIIAWVIMAVIMAGMAVVAFGPAYFEWREERAIKKASEKYVEKFGGHDGR